MTGVAKCVLVLVLVATPALAEPVPPGAIGLVSGAVSGSGADAKRLGFGYYQFGMQASWQPTTTNRKLGPTLRWATMFGTLYCSGPACAAQIEPTLKTVQMDLTVGMRVRPWTSPSRYLTLRAGGELMRVNEPLMRQETQRSFGGAIASAGFDQYLGGFLLSIDVHYGMIGTTPSELALLVGIGFAGP